MATLYAPEGLRPHRRPWPTLLSWLTVLLVGLMILGLLVVKVLETPPKIGTVPYYHAAPDIAQMATQVPAATFTAVAANPVPSWFSPRRIDGPVLTARGASGRRVPEVLVVLSESCTSCASERWALLAALGRFGTFSNLGYATSSSTVVPPSLPTFSFREVRYASPYLALRAVELQGDFREGNGRYPATGHLTRAEERLLERLDARGGAPAVASTPGIAPRSVLPFVDLGGRSVLVGTQVPPSMLLGQRRMAVASGLSDPTNPTTVTIIAAANELVRQLCTVTHDRPTSVCR